MFNCPNFQPKTTETVHRIEERKRTEEIERRVLRRERRHKSHRSRYSHGHQQEAIGWQGGGGAGWFFARIRSFI